MTANEVIDYYWKYYCSLEAQVIELERFVEFDLKNNGRTYSSRFLELYQAICSEIDVLGKVLAKDIDPSFATDKRTTIKTWWFIVQNKYKDIQVDPVFFHRETLYPWGSFYVIKKNDKHVNDPSKKNANVPEWWNSYNNIKHRRTDISANGSLFFVQANLENVIMALSGLFILEAILLERVHGIVESSNLFSSKSHRVFSFSFGGV